VEHPGRKETEDKATAEAVDREHEGVNVGPQENASTVAHLSWSLLAATQELLAVVARSIWLGSEERLISAHISGPLAEGLRFALAASAEVVGFACTAVHVIRANLGRAGNGLIRKPLIPRGRVDRVFAALDLHGHLVVGEPGGSFRKRAREGTGETLGLLRPIAAEADAAISKPSGMSQSARPLQESHVAKMIGG